MTKPTARHFCAMGMSVKYTRAVARRKMPEGSASFTCRSVGWHRCELPVRCELGILIRFKSTGRRPSLYFIRFHADTSRHAATSHSRRRFLGGHRSALRYPRGEIAADGTAGGNIPRESARQPRSRFVGFGHRYGEARADGRCALQRAQKSRSATPDGGDRSASQRRHGESLLASGGWRLFGPQTS